MRKIFLIFVFLLFTHRAWAGSGINLFVDRIDVTPDNTGWQDVNVSSYVPAGATGAITLSTGSTSRRATLRENGSTDTRTPLRATDPQTGLVGLDADGVFEVYMNDVTNDKLYLIGYTTASTDFLTNSTDVTPSTKDSWVDVTFSDVPTRAAGVILEFVSADGATESTGGLRANGSTDTFTAVSNYARNWYLAAALDSNKVAEVYASLSPAVTVYLIGWFMPPVTFETNAVSYALSMTGSWRDITVSSGNAPVNANGAIWLIFNTDPVNARPGGVRAEGSADDNYGSVPPNSSSLWFTVLDSNRGAEGQIGNAQVDHYVIGYAQSQPAKIQNANISNAKIQ